MSIIMQQGNPPMRGEWPIGTHMECSRCQCKFTIERSDLGLQGSVLQKGKGNMPTMFSMKCPMSYCSQRLAVSQEDVGFEVIANSGVGVSVFAADIMEFRGDIGHQQD